MNATGPRTDAGKAASSRNAVTHGLLSETPLVTCLETAEEWDSHLTGVLADLAPHGQMETCLAERAGLLLWRLRRLGRAEVEWIDLAQAGSEKEWKERAGGTLSKEAGEGYEDQLEFAADCRELLEFARTLAETPAETPVPGDVAASYLYTLPEVISLPILQAHAAAGLDRLKDPEELDWTVAGLRAHVARAAAKLDRSPEQLEEAVLIRLAQKAGHSAAHASRCRELMQAVRCSRLLPTSRQLETLTRYEAHLGRELSRTMKALRELQSRRTERPIPNEPVRSDGGKGPGLPVATVPNAAEAPAYANGPRPHSLTAAPKTEKCETNPFARRTGPAEYVLPGLPARSALAWDVRRRDTIRAAHWCVVS